MSRLHIKIGPMGSGKTTDGLRELGIQSSLNRKTCYITHVIDNRNNNHLPFSTHNESVNRLPTSTIAYKIDNLKSFVDMVIDDDLKYDLIMIDEAHFFIDLFESVKLLLLHTQNTDIIVCGLDGDYMMNPIGQILELIPLSDTCIKLNSKCVKCNAEDLNITNAPFTLRTIDNDEQILIGGMDMYLPVCRSHHIV